MNSYYFHTIIKSKNSNLNYLKSGTGYIFVTTAQIKILIAYIFNRKNSEIYLTRPSDLASHWGLGEESIEWVYEGWLSKTRFEDNSCNNQVLLIPSHLSDIPYQIRMCLPPWL